VAGSIEACVFAGTLADHVIAEAAVERKELLAMIDHVDLDGIATARAAERLGS
jgi:hypothetical protein